MKLDEAFKIYSDEQILVRRKWINDGSVEYKDYMDIDWLKGLKYWGKESHRKEGFFILPSMIEDANADDWELLDGKEIKLS